MSAYYETEGCLLSSRPIGEADRRLIFYTKDLGKVDALAKSVRRTDSKLKGHLNLFTRSRLIFVSGKGLWRLLDAELLQVGDEYKDLAALQVSANFLLGLLIEREPSDALWGLVENFHKIQTPDIIRFKARVLDALGMLPEDAERAIFFGQTGAAYIRGEADDSAVDREAFEAGIRKILALNHF